MFDAQGAAEAIAAFDVNGGAAVRPPARPPARDAARPLKALQVVKVREKLVALGVDRMPMSPDEFAAHVEREVALNALLAQKAGLKAE